MSNTMIVACTFFMIFGWVMADRVEHGSREWYAYISGSAANGAALALNYF